MYCDQALFPGDKKAISRWPTARRGLRHSAREHCGLKEMGGVGMAKVDTASRVKTAAYLRRGLVVPVVKIRLLQ